MLRDLVERSLTVGLLPRATVRYRRMRIAIGADHAGYPLNERVIEELRNER